MMSEWSISTSGRTVLECPETIRCGDENAFFLLGEGKKKERERRKYMYVCWNAQRRFGVVMKMFCFGWGKEKRERKGNICMCVGMPGNNSVW
jgi:hypothetical protein